MNNISLDMQRHSAAHVMAQAIQRVFPQEKIEFGIGPTIEHGFYYDIKMSHTILDEELSLIENEMKKIIQENLPVVRQVLNKIEALQLFQQMGQSLKLELIEDLPEGEEISCYRQGEFTDLCRGPHVESTGQLTGSFKLLHTAGAYWRGDSSRPMLQRIYAVYFSDKKELRQHLNFLEEAQKRDHRKLGTELELFHFEKEAPASPFFMPKGAFIYHELVNFLRRILVRYNYQEVITPQILDIDLWHRSGHYQNYKENMYFTSIDEREFAIKPMNCPTHMLMFKHYKYSYRDLPMRLADFGRLHRYEKSGVIAGLTRVRTFCQDDGHVFLEPTQIQEEISQMLEMVFTIYNHFGFEKVKINLATRPTKKMGDDAAWDAAEQALQKALEASGREYQILPGDGAFYGPKIDIKVSDAINRYHQLGTIQLDFQLPEKFDLKYTNSQGELVRPIVIHRALLGSLERFFWNFIGAHRWCLPFLAGP